MFFFLRDFSWILFTKKSFIKTSINNHTNGFDYFSNISDFKKVKDFSEYFNVKLLTKHSD